MRVIESRHDLGRGIHPNYLHRLIRNFDLRPTLERLAKKGM